MGLTIILTVIALLLGCILSSAAPAPVVKTTSGPLQGQIASGTSGVYEYLGTTACGKFTMGTTSEIFRVIIDPGYEICTTKHPHLGLTSVTTLSEEAKAANIDLTQQGAELMVSILGQADVSYSEDCLTLNVWTKPQQGETNKAVLLWIYGGGYNTGSTDNAAYNGKYIADLEDVIIVTVNYRLNIFGFPGDPHITNNLGLLDQRLAVEWVRDNIAAFGGDPTRITLFGQSAGGSSVDYYSYAWTSDPIVAGFIPESGTVLSPSSQANGSTSAASWYNVSSTLGCGNANSDPDQVLSCMRSKSWSAVQDAIPVGTGISGVTGGFGPTIDETVVFSDYVSRSEAGNFIKRPLFIGNNNYEVGLFKVIFGIENVTYTEAVWDYLELVIYTCPASYRALASVNNGVPTWRYRWFGDFPDLKLTEVPNSGAWHGSEIPVIWGTDEDIQSVVARTDVESAIATYTRGAWVAFAKDPVNGLTNYGLPGYNPLGATLLQLAYNNQTGANGAFPVQYDATCPALTVLTDILLDSGIL